MPDEESGINPEANETAHNVDLSGIHGELDKLKNQLCHCNHKGECVACRGFEILRDQVQQVVISASQPILMQVAQDVAVNDLMKKWAEAQEKLADDPRVQGLINELMERIQEDMHEEPPS